MGLRRGGYCGLLILALFLLLSEWRGRGRTRGCGAGPSVFLGEIENGGMMADRKAVRGSQSDVLVEGGKEAPSSLAVGT